jgi:excisionase family DNA binding protein
VRTRPHARRCSSSPLPQQPNCPKSWSSGSSRSPLLLAVEEAADMLMIGRSLMYELIRDGAVESIHIGRLSGVPREALSVYIAELGRRQPEPAEAI